MPYKDPVKRREYNRTYLREYYKRNRQRMIDESQKRRKILRRKKKQWIVDNLGGKCQKCGYNYYIGALDVHHLNPEEKDDDWKISLTSWSWKQIETFINDNKGDIVLLCSNCHREEHADLV